jgi:hypothetical protein
LRQLEEYNHTVERTSQKQYTRKQCALSQTQQILTSQLLAT